MGIPLWLAREYLVKLGGVCSDDERVLADGWEARLIQLPDYLIGSLRAGQIRLELTTDQPTYDQLWRLLDSKLIRDGG